MSRILWIQRTSKLLHVVATFSASLHMSVEPWGSALALQSFGCLAWELIGCIGQPEQMLDLCGVVMPF